MIESQSLSLNGVAKTRSLLRIDKLFQSLVSDYKVADLSNYSLLCVGDHLREHSSNAKDALPYYQEVLGRSDEFGRFRVMQNIGEVLGFSGEQEDRDRGLAILEKLGLLAIDNLRVREKALLARIRILAHGERWVFLEIAVKLYLKDKYLRHAAEASYWLAIAYDRQGKVDDALHAYAMVFARYAGYLRFSTLSVKRVMELLWKRNQPKGAGTRDVSDRQSAYDIGIRFIHSTQRIRKGNPKMTIEEKRSWDDVHSLVKKYKEHADVRSGDEK